MKPIKFKEQNCTYAENQPEYGNLPSYKDSDGVVTSCWELSLTERLRVLFTGKIWMGLWSGDRPLTPSLLTTKKSELIVNTDKIVSKNVKLFYKLLRKNTKDSH